MKLFDPSLMDAIMGNSVVFSILITINQKHLKKMMIIIKGSNYVKIRLPFNTSLIVRHRADSGYWSDPRALLHRAARDGRF